MASIQPPPGMDVEESIQPNIIAAVVILWVGGTAGVVMRYMARAKAGLSFGWDDYLVFFSWIPFAATCVANFLGVHYGAGRHIIWVVQHHSDYSEDFLKYIYAVEILYPFIIAPIKCSICFLYIRLFGISKPFRFYCYGIIALSCVWGLALLFGSIFQCNPVRDAWDTSGDLSTCVDLKSFLVGTNTPNVVLDFLILTAPFYMIWKLRVAKRKRLLIIAVLVLGAGETAFSVVRLVELTSMGMADPTWDYFSPIIWSTVEQSVGILCACLPVLGPLLPEKFLERVKTGGSGNRYRSRYNNSKGSSHALGSMSKSSKFNKLGDSGHDLESSYGFDDSNSATAIR